MHLIPRSSLPDGGIILLLNGTSSSGKTSLAKAMQSAMPERQFLHVRLDAFREMEPAGFFGASQAASAPLRVAALCRAMHAAVAEYAGHGQNVIFDHVLSAAAWHYLLEDFDKETLYLIEVQCAIGELLRREAARCDRPPGLAQSQVDAIHAGRDYDLSIDTTSSDPARCAASVREWLLRDPAALAFKRMRARHPEH